MVALLVRAAPNRRRQPSSNPPNGQTQPQKERPKTRQAKYQERRQHQDNYGFHCQHGCQSQQRINPEEDIHRVFNGVGTGVVCFDKKKDKQQKTKGLGSDSTLSQPQVLGALGSLSHLLHAA